MRDERMTIHCRRGAHHDSVEMQKETQTAEVLRHVERPLIEPDVLPRRGIPLLPGEAADAVRQIDGRQVSTIVLSLLPRGTRIAFKRPSAIERDRSTGRAWNRSGGSSA